MACVHTKFPPCQQHEATQNATEFSILEEKGERQNQISHPNF